MITRPDREDTARQEAVLTDARAALHDALTRFLPRMPRRLRMKIDKVVEEVKALARFIVHDYVSLAAVVFGTGTCITLVLVAYALGGGQ